MFQFPFASHSLLHILRFPKLLSHFTVSLLHLTFLNYSSSFFKTNTRIHQKGFETFLKAIVERKLLFVAHLKGCLLPDAACAATHNPSKSGRHLSVTKPYTPISIAKKVLA